MIPNEFTGGNTVIFENRKRNHEPYGKKRVDYKKTISQQMQVYRFSCLVKRRMEPKHHTVIRRL